MRRNAKLRRRKSLRRKLLNYFTPLRVEPLEGRLALAILTVNSFSDGPINLTDSTVTLRDAIDAANRDVPVSPGGPSGSGADEIRFQVTPSETITLLQGQLEIRSSLTITGPGASVLSISANLQSRVFNVDDGVTAERTVTISGLTISDGNASGSTGGGIFNAENLTVQNSTISGNRADRGGGMQNSGGTLTVRNSTISDNQGGGIRNEGMMTLQNSTVSGNSAGGIGNLGTATIQNSTVSGNSAGSGAGIDNSAILTVQNCTITQNRSESTHGGGLLAIGDDADTTLHNTIVADNFGGSSQSENNIDVLNAKSITGTNNLVGTGDSGGLINGTNGNIVGVADPMLGPLADNGGPTKTHALLPGGPAINAGNNAQAPSFSNFDQRGAPFLRVANGKVDIGAFEANPISFIVDTDVDEDDGNVGPGHLSLREAINQTNASGGADTIAFAASFFKTPHVIALNNNLGQITIADDLTIIGPGADLLSIDGNSNAAGLKIDDAQAGQAIVKISGLTISRLLAIAGGGIANAENLTVDSCVIRDNVALNIFNSGAGGGIFNSGNLTVVNSTISGNIAGTTGGGISSDIGSVIVSNSTISGNSASTDGGGIFISGTSSATRLDVQNSTITANHANSNNDATGLGGGIRFSTAALGIDYTIVADNYVGSGTSTESDISAASGSVGAGSAYNVIGTGGSGGLTNGTNGNQVGVADPRLGALADNGGPTKTHALLGGSPAVDAGDPAVTNTFEFDQRGPGFPRITGGVIDIGAFEAEPISLVVDNELDEVDANAGPGDLSLREAINLANTNGGVDAITFAPAMAGKTILLTLNELPIVDSVTIQGPTKPIIIDGRQASRLFNITTTAKNVTIANLTFTGGKTTANSQRGGAINSNSTGELIVRNSTISGNATGGRFSGGGGLFTAGSLTLTDSTISGNSTSGYSSGGGGISVTGALTIANSTISGNSTTGDFADGGGVFAFGTTLVTNSTITGNSVAGTNAGTATDGGGIYANGPLTIRLSIVAGNQDIQDARNPDLRAAGALTVVYSLIGDNNNTVLPPAPLGSPDDRGNLIGTHATPIDPRLAPLANNGGTTQTHALCTAASAPVASCTAASPALNAGSNAVLPGDTADLDDDGDTIELIPFDQRGLGFNRIFNTIVDMGSFESQPGFPWHNFTPGFANDVRGGPNNQPDGHIVADDVIAIINYINAKGSGKIPNGAAVGLPFGFLDTKADNQIVAEDVISVINFINAHPGQNEPWEGEAASASLAPSADLSTDEMLMLLATDLTAQSARARRIR